jgi:hypothetical protein
MSMNKKILVLRYIPILLSFLIIFLLVWRWQVSVTRFFDPDEYSYMHWAAQVARGEHMYTDFYSYFTPGFMWVFAPIFWIYGASIQVFMAGRVVSYMIFLGILGSLGYLYGITRGWKWALLPIVILTFLPMPYDKFLEIRPDNLAMLLAILGLICEISGIRGQSGKNGRREIWWLVSGLLYSASLFVLAKTLPIVAVGGGIAVISSWRDWKKILFFFLGLLAPWIVFFLSAAVFGNFSVVWYSLTKLPFEAYKFSLNYYMGANLFFYPNALFYGGNGYTITSGLIVNHAIWILGLCVGAYRLVTPARGKKNELFVELLVSGVFFVSVAAYVKYFPMKHTQYLIPIAVFVAYYAADGLSGLFYWIERLGGRASFGIVLLGFSYLVIVITKDINAPKLLNANTVQITELSTLIHTIPLSTHVVDLEGRMVFWPDGYPVSSLPFDEFLSYVSRRPLPLAQYLDKYPADYIYDGDSNRFITFTAENLVYIHSHFAPVAGFSNRLWKKL